MTPTRIRELAWEAVDNQPSGAVVILPPDEMLWLLRRWPAGRRAVTAMQQEFDRREATDAK